MIKKIFLLQTLVGFFVSIAYGGISDGWEKQSMYQLHPAYLYVEDIDGDGDFDVLTTTDYHPGEYNSEVAWFRNNGGGAAWDKILINAHDPMEDTVKNANGITAGDIDNDGRIDVAVATLAGTIYWYKAPVDASSGIWQRFQIEEDAGNSFAEILLFDFNNDGFQDILAGGYKRAVIFLNPGNPDSVNATWEKHSLADGTGVYINLDDINGDGNTDILSSNALSGSIEYIDVAYNNASFVFKRNAIDSVSGTFDSFCLDITGDGKKDVIATNISVPTVFWYEAPSESNGTWTKHVLADNIAGMDLSTGDINADGIPDIVVSSFPMTGGSGLKKISWLEGSMINGRMNFTEHIIDDTVKGPGDNSLNDFDGDGDLDLVVTGSTENEVYFYENKLFEPVIEMRSFFALPRRSKVTLLWVTKNENKNKGFNIYRSETIDGTYVKINNELIKAKGSSAKGALYTFDDEQVKRNITYYYKLQVYGQKMLYGPKLAAPRGILF